MAYRPYYNLYGEMGRAPRYNLFGDMARTPRNWRAGEPLHLEECGSSSSAASVSVPSNRLSWRGGQQPHLEIPSSYGGAAGPSSPTFHSGFLRYGVAWNPVRKGQYEVSANPTTVSNEQNFHIAHIQSIEEDPDQEYSYEPVAQGRGFPKRIPSPEIPANPPIPDTIWSKQMKCYITREKMELTVESLGFSTGCLMAAVLKIIGTGSSNLQYSRAGQGIYSAANPPMTPSRTGFIRSDSKNNTPIYSPEVMKRCVFPGGFNTPRKPKTPATPGTRGGRRFPGKMTVAKLGYAGGAVDGAEPFFGKGDTFFETCCSHTHLVTNLSLKNLKGGSEWSNVPNRMVKVLVLTNIYGSLISNVGEFSLKGKWFTLRPEVVVNYEEFKLVLIKQDLRSAFTIIVPDYPRSDHPVSDRWERVVSGHPLILVLDRTLMRISPTEMCDVGDSTLPIGTWKALPPKRKEAMVEWAIEGSSRDFKHSAKIWGHKNIRR